MWEYKVIQTNPKYKADKPFENKLNKLGKEGWELAGVQEKALYFKRFVGSNSMPVHITNEPIGIFQDGLIK